MKFSIGEMKRSVYYEKGREAMARCHFLGDKDGYIKIQKEFEALYGITELEQNNQDTVTINIVGCGHRLIIERKDVL